MQETQVRSLDWEDLLEEWQPTPVFLPRESNGQRSLVDHSPWGHKESEMTEATEHARMLKPQASFLGHFWELQNGLKKWWRKNGIRQMSLHLMNGGIKSLNKKGIMKILNLKLIAIQTQQFKKNRWPIHCYLHWSHSWFFPIPSYLRWEASSDMVPNDALPLVSMPLGNLPREHWLKLVTCSQLIEYGKGDRMSLLWLYYKTLTLCCWYFLWLFLYSHSDKEGLLVGNQILSNISLSQHGSQFCSS